MRFSRVCIMIVCLLTLVGCVATKKEQVTPSKLGEEVKEPSLNVLEDDKKNKIQPIQINEKEFNRVHDWIDEKTIIYSYVKENIYYIDTYNIFTKEFKNILKTNDTVVQVIVHPERQKILIQTAPFTYQANVIITDVDGNIITQQSIDSSELSIIWNDYDDDQLLMTAFADDWTYKVYKFHIATMQLEEITHLQPFFKWLNNDFVLEQRWDDEVISLSAPLWKTNINNPNLSEQLLNDLYYFQLFSSDLFMTITVPNADDTVFHYHFYDKEKEIYQFETYNITQFSDWVVPNYSFNEENQSFYTFLPNHHGSVDTYGGLYTLKAFDLKEKIERVLIEDIENKPLRCDKSTTYCLYGYQLESVIDLEKGTIESVVQLKPSSNE